MSKRTIKIEHRFESMFGCTLHKDAHLYWYYQPQAEIITPRRILTQNGLAKQAYIGMKDGNLL